MKNSRIKVRLGMRMRGYFLAGVLITLPVSVTLWLTWVFLNFIDNRVAKLLPDGVYPESGVPGLGLLIVICFLILIGWLTAGFLGRYLVRLSESILSRMPVIRNLYSAIKQIVETVLATRSDAFREAVLMEYPRKGVWSIGFVTGTSRGEVQTLTSNETINVFVPTTPNPTSGYLLFVPKKDVHYLDMTVEEAVKLIVSGGIITPPEKTSKKKTSKK